MPDFKLWDVQRSRRYLVAPDYPEIARQAVAEMHHQVSDLHVDEDGLALRGVLVRHLVMPGMVEDTREIMSGLASLSRDMYVNVMDQYYLAWKAKDDPRYSSIDRHVYPQEMAEALEAAQSAGLWRLDRRWRDLRMRRPIPVIAEG